MKRIVDEDECLPTVFSWYKAVGVWPPKFQSNLAKHAYQFYSICVSILLISMALSEVLNACFAPQSFTELLEEELFIVILRVNVLFRYFMIKSRRNKISQLKEECLDDRWFNREDQREIDIIQRHKSKSRSTLLTYFGITSLCGILMCVPKNLEDLHDYENLLPVNAWYPYDTMKTTLNFWITFLHQTIALSVAIVVHCANLGLISGMMIQICMQLEILKYRITRVTLVDGDTDKPYKTLTVINQRELLKRCIQDHISILRFAKNVNDTFAIIQFVFFFAATMILCTTVYHLAKQPLFNMKFFMLLNYNTMILVQVYYFCWYGNEIALSSLGIINAVAQMDSTKLTLESQKTCVLIITYALKPIQITCGGVIVWNVDSFISILKTTYSVFNVLQRST